MEEQKNSETTAKSSNSETTAKSSNNVVILSVLLAATVALLAFNFIQQFQLDASIERQTALLSLGGSTGALDQSTWTADEKMNYEMHGIIPERSKGGTQNTPASSASFSDVVPKGIPAVYGQELGISYDDVSPSNQQKANATIDVLAAFDTENSGKFISLSGDKLQRYIKIASQISCEYCCGAESIIFSNGSAACGCAHSYSMRGLAKYLLTNHANEFTDDQILEELGKWKTLYFPSILAQKAAVLKQKGIEFNYINLASNKYRGIEKGASSSGGSMVGGC